MNKIKDFCKMICEKIKHNVNLGKERPLGKSLILIAVLALLPMLMQFVAQGFRIAQFHPVVFLMNFIPIFLVMCFFYFTIGKISISYGITTIVLAVLLAINHYKINFRDEPLNFTDLSLGTEANNIVKNYTLSIDLAIIFLVLFTVLSIVYIAIKVRNKRPGLLPSIVGTVLSVVLVITMNFAVYSRTSIYSALLTETFHETTTVANKGLVYSLFNSANIKDHDVPDDYSDNAASEALDKYKTEEETEKKPPNVIAVMCEAFTDIQKWDNVKFTDHNPYEYYNYLKTIGCYGELFTPSFGGGTAATEFEFLTGNNTSAINSNMPIAYKTLINDDIDSIVRVFKKMGYHASAMHPGDPWFYNRQNVYPRMGFDTFTSKVDLPYDIPPHVVGYVKDSVSAEMIINDYNRHLEENPEQGYFNFLVTIQNHGPYEGGKLIYGDEYISKDHGLTDEQYNIINNYLGGVNDSDEFMKTIHEYINTLDEPTVFLIFGDHLPYLDQYEQVFAKLGLDIASGTYQAYENKYSSDYVMVGNQAFLKEYTPSINGEQSIISANYLSIKLFQYCNLNLTPFQSLSLEMMQYAPIISRQHNGSSAGFDEVLPEEFETLFKEYKNIQYYNLNDYEVPDKDGEEVTDENATKDSNPDDVKPEENDNQEGEKQ